MANPERGEVGLTATRTVDGQPQTKEYTLKMSTNAAVALQRKCKKPMSEIVAHVEKMDFEAIRDIAFMLLQKHHADEIKTQEQAGDVLDDLGSIGKFFDAFRQLMEVNQPPQGEGSANPLVTQTPTGDSSISKPVAVN
jgi:hypothetical protein